VDISLRDNLAKLMCTQEYVYRRNINYAESKDKVFYPVGFSVEMLIAQKRDQEEGGDSAIDESDSEPSGTFEVPSNPTASGTHKAKPETSKRGDQKKEEREALSVPSFLCWGISKLTSAFYLLVIVNKFETTSISTSTSHTRLMVKRMANHTDGSST
jgi:hypothetical protein